RGTPDNLFIEDAIQETTTMPFGISAEYGRFTGGVVSTITKSGGNDYTASVRDNLTNARWTAKTPIETTPHIDKLNNVYEETLGGYIRRDRPWFFGAGRQAKTDTQAFTSTTNIAYDCGRDEKRAEGKLTGAIGSKHSITASYLDIKDQRVNDNQFNVMDLNSLFNRELPNSLFSSQWNGIFGTNLLTTVSYARKKFAFVGSGSPFTDLINGPLLVDNVRTTRFWTSTFCGTCGDEERNNFDWSGKANYFLSTRSMGSHSIVGGVDRFSETRLANNHQSGSDFRIVLGTQARIVNNIPYPVFDNTAIVQWNPIFNLAHGTHLVTRSAFVNDKWDLNNHFSFNIGLRYDKNNGRDDDGHLISDDSAFSPRLGVLFDIRGDGRHRLSANYSRYVSKIADGNVGGGGNSAGNPSTFQWRYNGPSVNGSSIVDNQLLTTDKALAILWDWFQKQGGTTNFTTIANGGAFIGALVAGLSTQFPEPIVSPSVDEITLGYSMQINPNAYARVDLVKRDWHNFYAGQMLATNPHSVDQFGNRGDIDFTVNDDSNIKRYYRGVDFQGVWRKGHL